MSTVWKLVVFSSAFHIGEAACSAGAACTEKETTSSPSLVQAKLKKYKLSLSDVNEKLVEEDEKALDAKERRKAATKELDPSIQGEMKKPVMQGAITYLWQEAFDKGTYIISSPGVYVLQQDIVFEPRTTGCFPEEKNGGKIYMNENGYWLGFFAAISITANNVVLDLNGHSIGMSKKMSLIQRYFSVIELASKPFPASVGPPQFAALSHPAVPASRTVVMNGRLGLSSHMGIHGTDNSYIAIKDIVIEDFETGGIQLNGATHVQIMRVTVGPSLGAAGSVGKVPGLAVLSQSQLLLRVIKGSGHEHETEFLDLQTSVDEFIEEKTGGTARPVDAASHFFDDAAQGFDGRPDGSALYGILFHLNRPAIGDFAGCSSAQKEMLDDDPSKFSTIIIKDVTIKNLELKSDEVIKMTFEGDDGKHKPVLGPAGDVVQVLRLRDGDDHYKATPLSNAQRKVAELQNVARASSCAEDKLGAGETAAKCLFKHFGSANIPDQVMSWMHESQMSDTNTFAQMIEGAKFHCHGDAMSHFNKGVVGLRLEFVRDVTLENISISGLINKGQKSEHDSFCTGTSDAAYKGADVRGVSIGGLTTLLMGDDGLPSGVTVEMESCSSESGQTTALVDEGITVNGTKAPSPPPERP